jgi:predicted MFS family arabinose efflux permease
MQAKELTVKSNQTASPIALYLWIMFAICFLGNVMAGSVSTIMSVYLPVIVRELTGSTDEGHLNRISSLINTLYLAGWTIGGFTWGYVSDHIGRARSLAISVSMFGIFTLATAAVSSWEILMIFRFLSGLGVGGTLVMNATLLSEAWPERSRAIFIGFLSMGFPIGIITSGTVNFMVANWRIGFLLGLLPLAVGLLSFRWLKESEIWKIVRIKQKPQINLELLGGQRSNLINGSIIFGCMLIGLWSVFSWLPTWVQSLLSQADGSRERGMSMMLLGAGGLTGGFLSGWISRALGTRRAMLLVFACSFILSILLFKTNTLFSGIILAEIALLALMFGISQGLLGYYIPLLFPVAIRGTATGFCFNTGRIVTTIAVLLIGWLVIALGGYSASLFTFSFVFLIGYIVLYYSKNIVK